MKNIIITGVTGQDGSYMVEYLLENTDYRIIGVARRVSNPNYSNLGDVIHNPRFTVVSGDLGDSHSINNLVQEYQPEYFINFAAQSHVHESWRVPEQTFDTDATGVLRILEAVRKYAKDCRVYNAGSSEEFGNVMYSPQDEQHPLRPRSPYGAAKAAARHLTKVYRESYNLYAIQGALFNHESKKRGHTFVTKRITKNVSRIFHEIQTPFVPTPLSLGNLDAKRDWSHAKDFVEGIWMMINQEKYVSSLKNLNREELPKHIKEYILSSQETHSVREFVELSFKFANFEKLFTSPISFEWRGNGIDEKYILKINDGTNREVIVVEINKELFRPAEVELLLGDSLKARKELGWVPKYSFEELVKEMVQYDIENP